MADKLEVSRPVVVRHPSRDHLLTVEDHGLVRLRVFGQVPAVELIYGDAGEAVSDLRALAGMVERAIAAAKPRRKAATPPNAKD